MRMFSPVEREIWAKCGRFRPKFTSRPDFDRKRPNSGLTFATFPVQVVTTHGAKMHFPEQSRNSG